MFGDSSHMSWGWTTFGAVHMLLFWIVLILAIVVLIKALGPDRGEVRPRHSQGALRARRDRQAGIRAEKGGPEGLTDRDPG